MISIYMSFTMCRYVLCGFKSQGIRFLYMNNKIMIAGIQLGFGCQIWQKIRWIWEMLLGHFGPFVFVVLPPTRIYSSVLAWCVHVMALRNQDTYQLSAHQGPQHNQDWRCGRHVSTSCNRDCMIVPRQFSSSDTRVRVLPHLGSSIGVQISKKYACMFCLLQPIVVAVVVI